MIDEVVAGLRRVVEPDHKLFEDVILHSGVPSKTQSLKYMRYNRQVVTQSDRTISLSVVALVNNRMARKFRLQGLKRRLSQKIFSLSGSLMDRFINNLRCDDELTRLMASASGDFTAIGVLHVEEMDRAHLFKRKIHRIHPVIVIPGIDLQDLERVVEFERRNEVKKVRMRGLPLYRTVKP